MASFKRYTTQPSLVVPSAAVGVSVTPNAVAWTNSSWYQVTAGIANNIAVCGFVINSAVASSDYNVDMGVGAATSETVAGSLLGDGETLGCESGVHRFGIPIYVAANTRIAVRLRKSETNTTAWTVKMVYYEVPAEAGDLSIAVADLFGQGEALD
jgi:hypothetical protein